MEKQKKIDDKILSSRYYNNHLVCKREIDDTVQYLYIERIILPKKCPLIYTEYNLT